MSFYQPPYATVQNQQGTPSYHGQASAVLYPQSQQRPYVPQQSYGYPVHQLQGAQGCFKSGSGVQLNPTAVSYQPYSQPLKDAVYNPYLNNTERDQYVAHYPNSYSTPPAAPTNLNTQAPDGSPAYSYLYRHNIGNTNHTGNKSAASQQKETFGFSSAVNHSHYSGSEKTTLSLNEPSKRQDGSTIEDIFKAKASQYGIDICTKAERIAKKVAAETEAARKEKEHQEVQQFHADVFRQKAMNCGIQIGPSKPHSEVLASNLDINSNSEHFETDIKKTFQSTINSSFANETIVKDTASVVTEKRSDDTTVFSSFMNNLGKESEEQPRGSSDCSAFGPGDGKSSKSLCIKLSVEGVEVASNGLDVTDSSDSSSDDDASRKSEEEVVASETEGIEGNVVLETLKALCSARVVNSSITKQKGKTSVQTERKSSIRISDEEQDVKDIKYLYTFDDMVSDYVDRIIKNAAQELQKCYLKEGIQGVEKNNVECELSGENICGSTSRTLEADFNKDKNSCETDEQGKRELDLKDTNLDSHDISHGALQPDDNTSQALPCSLSTCTSVDKNLDMVKDPEVSTPNSELSSNENDSELDNRLIISDSSSLNPSSPEFKPGTLKRLGIKGYPRSCGEISMRADAPVFKPTVQPAMYNPVPNLVVKSVKNKIVQTESKEYTEAAVNTKRTKQVSVVTETSSCDTREVYINTEESLFSHNSDFYTQVTTYSSQSTNTEQPDCRSVGVSVRPSKTGEKKDKGCMTDPLDMYQRLLNTQRELLHLRGQVCIMELQRQLDDLERNKHNLVHAFLAVDDSSFEATINARIASLKIEINQIQIQLLDYDEELNDGNTWETVPQFSVSVPVGPTNIKVVNKNSFIRHVKNDGIHNKAANFSWSDYRQEKEKQVTNAILKSDSEKPEISADRELKQECFKPELTRLEGSLLTENRSNAGSPISADSVQQKSPAVCPLEITEVSAASPLSAVDSVDTIDKGIVNSDTLASSFDDLNSRQIETSWKNPELTVGENWHTRSQDMSEEYKDEKCDTVSLSLSSDAQLRPCRSASSSSVSSSKSTTNVTTASALTVQADSVINHAVSETVTNRSVLETGTQLSRCSVTNIHSPYMPSMHTQHSVSSNSHSPVSVVASTSPGNIPYEGRKPVRNVVTSQFIQPEDVSVPSTSSSFILPPQVVIAPRVVAVQRGVAFTVPPPPPLPPPLPPPPSLSVVPPPPLPLVTSQPHSFPPSNFLPFPAMAVPRMPVPLQLRPQTPTISSHSQTMDSELPQISNQGQINVETTASVCNITENNTRMSPQHTLSKLETPLSNINTSMSLRPNSNLVCGTPLTNYNSSAILRAPLIRSNLNSFIGTPLTSNSSVGTVPETLVSSSNTNSKVRAQPPSSNLHALQRCHSSDSNLSPVPEHQDNQSALLGAPSISSNSGTVTGHTSSTTLTQTDQSHGRSLTRSNALSSASTVHGAPTLHETVAASQGPAVEQNGPPSSDVHDAKFSNSNIPPVFSSVSLQAPTNHLDQPTPALVSNSKRQDLDASAMPTSVTPADNPTTELPSSINPGLYKVVLSQLKQVYPDLATNPVMLKSVAVQQTQILQCYIAADNMAGLPDLSNLDPDKMLSLSSSMGSLPMNSVDNSKKVSDSQGQTLASMQNVEGCNSDVTSKKPPGLGDPDVLDSIPDVEGCNSGATSHGFKKPPGLGDPDVTDSIPDGNLLSTKTISPRLSALLTKKNTSNTVSHEAPGKQMVTEKSGSVIDKSSIVRPKNLLDNFKKLEPTKDIVPKVSIPPKSPDSDVENMPPLPGAVHSSGQTTSIAHKPLVSSYQQYDAPKNLPPRFRNRSESEPFSVDKPLQETRPSCRFQIDDRLHGKHTQTVSNASITSGEDWEEEIDPYNIETFKLSKEAVIPKQTYTSSQQSKERSEFPRPVSKPLPVGLTTKAKDNKTVDKEKIDDISDISLPFSAKSKVKDTITDDKIGNEIEDDGEDWHQVSKKKKKEPTTSRKRMASGDTSVSSKQKSNNFEKLVTKMSEVFNTLTRSEIIQVITEVRTQMGGLSGLTMLKILEKAREVIEKKMVIRPVQHPPTQPTDTKVQVVRSLRPALLPTPSSKPKSTGYTQKSRDVFQPPTKNVLSIPGKTFTSSKPLSMSVLPSRLSKYSCDEDEDICVICHDGLSMEETKSLDCGHVFHTECIKQWVLGRERTCPTCRRLALFPEEFPRLGK